MNNPIKPKLYVLGAGPGDPELITVKAYKILQQADVILYDNLANKDLLNISPTNCEKIYVGKRPYGDYTPQETIHEIIKEQASLKENIVRLKGGDPFIFGRGFEEILFAQKHGIETMYVPGITSMQAAGIEGIPLTHRAISESVWALTGTKKNGKLSGDLQLAMQSNATVVIYMGMKKIEEIIECYVSAGNGHIPAAIIQHASLPHKKIEVGIVRNLKDMAEKQQLTHPAIIIIGWVVGVESLI